MPSARPERTAATLVPSACATRSCRAASTDALAPKLRATARCTLAAAAARSPRSLRSCREQGGRQHGLDAGRGAGERLPGHLPHLRGLTPAGATVAVGDVTTTVSVVSVRRSAVTNGVCRRHRVVWRSRTRSGHSPTGPWASASGAFGGAAAAASHAMRRERGDEGRSLGLLRSMVVHTASTNGPGRSARPGDVVRDARDPARLARRGRARRQARGDLVEVQLTGRIASTGPHTASVRRGRVRGGRPRPSAARGRRPSPCC